MKKNVALRVAAIVFLLVIISLCFVCELMVSNAGLEHGFLPQFAVLRPEVVLSLGGLYAG